MTHADADTLFSFEGVSVVSRDGTHRLRDVDLAIPAGRTTALVGPSGAGKSTLLRLCNILEVPTAGRVLFRGTPLDEVDPRAHRRRVGMVFQDPVTFPGTALDNLAVADPDATSAERADVLDAVGLPASLGTRTADDLSGGEAQRLCIARALLTRPEVLLLDEPTSALDQAARDEVEALADRLAERGVTLVWITHDRAQAARLGSHVVALRDGRVEFAGSLDQAAAAGVLGDPTDDVTAQRGGA